jgi:hypothetical protein
MTNGWDGSCQKTTWFIFPVFYYVPCMESSLFHPHCFIVWKWSARIWKHTVGEEIRWQLAYVGHSSMKISVPPSNIGVNNSKSSRLIWITPPHTWIMKISFIYTKIGGFNDMYGLILHYFDGFPRSVDSWNVFCWNKENGLVLLLSTLL